MVQSTNDETGVSPATSPYPLVLLRSGAGTEDFYPAGQLYSTTAGVQTGANTTETTAVSYSLPANQLAANGQTLTVEVATIFAANANAKTVRLKFGTYTLVLNPTTASPNGGTLSARCTFIRTSASAQLLYADGRVGATGQAIGADGGVGQSCTSAIAISVTIQNGAASPGDILFLAMRVMWWPY